MLVVGLGPPFCASELGGGLAPAIFSDARCKNPPIPPKILRTLLSERNILVTPQSRASSSTGLRGLTGFELSVYVNICSTKVLQKGRSS